MSTVFTIYHNPTDFPGKYVVRRFVDNVPAPDVHAVVDTIDQAREAIPEGLMPFHRHRDDDPIIVETWL